MENSTCSPSVSVSKQVLHSDELFMQQGMLFSDSLNELKNLRKQLYSAAEYFESSYRIEEQKQIVVETLKDYAIKAFINSVDHLGSVAHKVNEYLDEKIDDVSGSHIKICGIEQRIQTCHAFIRRREVTEQSPAQSFLKHHKRYKLSAGETIEAVSQYNVLNHSVEEDLYKCDTGATGETSPTIVSMISEGYSAPQSPLSSPSLCHFSRTIREKPPLSPHYSRRMRNGSLIKRSTTVNSSTSKHRYPPAPRRTVSMCNESETDWNKDNTDLHHHQHSGKSKRLLKSLISMRKNGKDAILCKYLDA